TLGFAVITPGAVLPRSWILGDGVEPGRPIVLGYRLVTGRSYYLFVLVVFVLAAVFAHNVRRSGLGRLLVAVRDNEDNARAFTVSAQRMKLVGFLIAGFIAGVGGAAYGHLLPLVGGSVFLTRFS